ncbi:MAG: hypothetical protein IJO74_04360 [Clostridia bacterium]|nr:hypothetical protein [Clostridia bacterium]
MKKNLAISGLHVGEHSFVPENLINEFESRNVKDTSYLVIRPSSEQVEPKYFYEWAKWCADHKVYFMTLYTMQYAPEGKESQFTPDVVAEIKKIAGEYFMGDIIGEIGTLYGARPKGYGAYMKQGLDDLKDCRDYFLDATKHYMDIADKLGIPAVMSVEATALVKYVCDAGCDIPGLEVMPGDPEFLISLLRGCAYSYGKNIWGTYIAHEWYGGIRQDDYLKAQRLKIAYRYTYLSGSHIVCLESGDEKIESLGYNFDADHPICAQYRQEMADCEKRFREIPRIAEEPLTKVALVYGYLDAYTGWEGNCIWEQYDRDEWSMGPSEWSWRITADLRHARSWQDIENFGDDDLSGSPAYGLYDVVPAETSAEKLAKYDTVIFVGWNSMTQEIYNNLKEYVKNGGHIFITAAHLNTNTKRDGKYVPINDGKTSDFLGCDIAGTQKLNAATKFLRESLADNVIYPVVYNGSNDPILPGGTFTAAKLENITGSIAAVWTDNYTSPKTEALSLTPDGTGHFLNGEEDLVEPSIIENKYGKGVVTFLSTVDYPGYGAVYPIYRMLTREFFTASHRRCDIHVKSSDKLRYSVYRDGSKDMLCLLNTDFVNPIVVTVEAFGKTYRYTVEPCDLKIEYIEH